MSKNTQNNKNFAIGDHIWFNQNWVGPSAGTITAVNLYTSKDA